MTEINIRELKTHASDIMRNVSKRRQRYVVTRRGRKVGAIVPVPEAENPDSDTAGWADFQRLAKELSSKWKRGVDSVGLVSSMRR
ncbi:MAG: type II toxin-antitoxin system Phd/YefM family antitoxin [Deltaproteobacteria bacterium]|nr:type II toxin-antitoxin system Phd/YefM family antitoxin [Deltaproteobacteria bacterium]